MEVSLPIRRINIHFLFIILQFGVIRNVVLGIFLNYGFLEESGY